MPGQSQRSWESRVSRQLETSVAELAGRSLGVRCRPCHRDRGAAGAGAGKISRSGNISGMTAEVPAGLLRSAGPGKSPKICCSPPRWHGRADAVPAGHLTALADAGLYGIAGPASAGGIRVRPPHDLHVIEIMAGGCLATTFVWIQHHSAVRALAASPNAALRAQLAATAVPRQPAGGHRARRRPARTAAAAGPAGARWLGLRRFSTMGDWLGSDRRRAHTGSRRVGQPRSSAPAGPAVRDLVGGQARTDSRPRQPDSRAGVLGALRSGRSWSAP